MHSQVAIQRQLLVTMANCLADKKKCFITIHASQMWLSQDKCIGKLLSYVCEFSPKVCKLWR